jgi:hypothetical protein
MRDAARSEPESSEASEAQGETAEAAPIHPCTRAPPNSRGHPDVRPSSASAASE